MTGTLRALLPAVEEAARLAMRYYRGELSLAAERKGDASLVTAADRAVEELLRRAIGEHFPDAALVGEEGGASPRSGAALTFAIDPIDGTEAFAARNPGWCISIGVLDQALRPIGGLVDVPTWGTRYLADLDPASPALADDRPLERPPSASPFISDDRTSIFIDSKAHLELDWRGFPGRCRSFGSTALHACLVAAQRGAVLAQFCAPAIWDIAGAHAIAARVGVTATYLDGAPLDYAPMLGGARAAGSVLVGRPAVIDAIRPFFTRLPASRAQR